MRRVLGRRSGVEHGTGIYFGCRSDDPTLHFGTATFVSRFTLDCSTLAITDRGSCTVHWDNGRSSTVEYVATDLAPALAPAPGTVTAGEFRGDPSFDQDLNVPLDSRICTDESGSVPTVGAVVLTLG